MTAIRKFLFRYHKWALQRHASHLHSMDLATIAGVEPLE